MMKKLMLAAGLAFALACAGPALASPTFDKEAKALSIDKAYQASLSATPDATLCQPRLDAIDKAPIAAEKRTGKPEDRSRDGQKGDAAASAEHRNHPLLL